MSDARRRVAKAKARRGGKWIAGSIRHPGALHRALGVPEGEKIPGGLLAPSAGDSLLMRRRKNEARTLARLH